MSRTFNFEAGVPHLGGVGHLYSPELATFFEVANSYSHESSPTFSFYTGTTKKENFYCSAIDSFTACRLSFVSRG